MGDLRYYIESGGFTQYLYRQVGTTITASNGVSGKIVTEYSDGDRYHSSLPAYSNTSEVYFKLSDETSKVEQARVYINRRVAFDFDWNHQHQNFQRGVVHVHEWKYDEAGNWTRSGVVRYMNDAEIKRYGELLLMANPDIKFKP